ncbi:thiosulfate oxidation carrier complex protein SoxZ [Paracoccus sp. S3-43]|uniref:thiosulfate oxidation carrier complex protein SoxZ n=1 Tax=Paracoccus sp. S3-43 TaxID=3030011 RepID=UPI003183A6F5
MRWKSAAQDGRTIGTLMIRHPNFSGLQRDQATLLNIPAHFIDRLKVRQGEDPVFRFAYAPNGQPVRVHAEDTDGNTWDQSFDAVNG